MITKLKFANHDEWLAIRSNYIGGSDAGAVAGMSPYRGAYAVWMEKTGRGGAFEGNLATRCGTYLEPLVAEIFEERTGKKVRRDNHTLVNDLYPWACANVDRRIVGENALLECKTTTSLPNLRKFKNGEYPETWYCQITHYMAVTGAERVYLAVLVSNNDFHIFTIERDQSEIDALMDIEGKFWESVKNDTPPQALAADLGAVSEHYGAEDTAEGSVDLTPELDLLSQYAEADADYRNAEARRDEIKARLCAALGSYTEGSAGGYRVRWTPTTSNRFDKNSFAKANPGIDLSPYFKTSTTRRFDFSRIK